MLYVCHSPTFCFRDITWWVATTTGDGDTHPTHGLSCDTDSNNRHLVAYSDISEQPDSAMAINTGIANISTFKLVTMHLKTRDKLHLYQALTQLPYRQKFDHPCSRCIHTRKRSICKYYITQAKK